MKGDADPEKLRAFLAERLHPIGSTPTEIPANPFAGDPMAKEVKTFTPAAVLVAIVTHPDGARVILTRRSETLRKHTGQVAFPGGRGEPGEAPHETALRETVEEIGLDPQHVDLVGLSSPYRTGTGYHVVPVIGLVRPGFTLSPDPSEVARVFETPFDLLMDHNRYIAREGEFPSGVKRQYYDLTYDGERIWGATAGMLRALSTRLYAS